MKWQPAAGHLVQDDAKCPNVASRVGHPSLQHFGGHVGQRARNAGGIAGLGLRAGHRRRLQCAHGNAEIENLGAPVRRDHDVRALEVPVHDAVSMGVLERVGELPPDARDASRGERAAG